MKMHQLFEAPVPSNITMLDVEDAARLNAFYEVVIKELNLDLFSFDPGNIGQSWDREIDGFQYVTSFLSRFTQPPSTFEIEMLPKILTHLVKKHLPEWKFDQVYICSNSPTSSWFSVAGFLEWLAKDLGTDEVPKHVEIQCLFGCPIKY